MGSDAPRDAWAELVRTAALVRASAGIEAVRRRPRRPLLRYALSTAVVAVAAGIALSHVLHATVSVGADGAADSTLFSLTNQDRASNGVRAVSQSGTLQSIGESARWTGCGPVIYGRSDDMITRDYFAHQIPPCNQYVFSMMQAYGVNYRLAGENIGWASGAGSATASATYINGQFMNSPDHRANILNAGYTHLGIGSWGTAAGATWHYPGSASYTDVWMFSEEFAELASAPPPPAPRPTPRPAPQPVPRNSPAPPPPALPPATSAPTAAAGAPTPTPTPAATATPIPAGLLPGYAPAPPVTTYEGLLPNSVESVLEAFLVD
jgi:uncharacterized protein YkwD